jgi:hypothetical protein
MSKADQPNKLIRSRRAVLAGGAMLAALSIPVIATATATTDPISAVIAAHW